MEILPQVQEALAYIKSVSVTEIQDKLQAARISYEKLAPLAGEPEAVFAVEDKTIEFPDRNINIRIYRPNGEKGLPAVVFFHGGGFFKGSLESHDRPLRQLANLSGVVIISVDYRLAPEYQFPHGVNDCIDATEWIISHAEELGIDGLSVAVAGDSAGGTLATAVAGKVKNILCQVLIYPATDSSLATSSWSTFAEGPILTLKSAVEFWNYYTEDKIQAAPIFNDDLSGMPDTLIIIGEYDPLLDEVTQYAQKLRQAYVEVTERLYPKMLHGFFQMGGVIDEGREAIETVARYIRYKLAP
ncbi:alpha/beta hydrolase [Chitinophaga filiformis]|uniref:Alpha/beta hydrolase n=1 Tax=Chitinophaga filiformis TaxID=104663 RepID=A0ABY4HVH9_CHIFI|nr:alpha/beta hydrolase [Chitinophaga filiformis]UPK67622.1 alpha/beta hydrolase [Chitinophaga filiformis]